MEQIAKKHRLGVSFVKKQLEMGIPIEHEHTKDKDLATDIALQHLDEIPDYYTRLKKMEASAKKEHKKFKDVTEGTLHHWFKGSRSKDGKPGWVQADGSPCANEPGETKTPKCFSSGRLKSLKKKGKKGEALIRSAIRRKRQKDKFQQSKTGASKPTNVPTFAKGKKDPNYVKAEPGIKEAMEINEARKDRPGKGSGSKDACYHKVKNRVKVWPSAYASGQLVQCRKRGASNWGTQKEATEMMRYCPKCNKDETRMQCKYGPKFWDMYSMPIKLKHYAPELPHPGNFPESYDHEHSMARSEISTIISAAKRLRKKMKGEGNIEAWVQSKITKAADYLDSAADYVDSGEMKEDFISEDWKRKIRSMSTSQIENLKRANPGASEKIDQMRQSASSRLSLPNINKPSTPQPQQSTNTTSGISPEERGRLEVERARQRRKERQRNRPGTIKKARRLLARVLFGPKEEYNNSIGSKSFSQFMIEASKSEMPCNKPKAEPHGHGETGKSHVVKACSDGKEKLIRFGQLGVKGSPKKKGESKEYRNRRLRFKARHSKNIAKGKMSAAYWSNITKW